MFLWSSAAAEELCVYIFYVTPCSSDTSESRFLIFSQGSFIGIDAQQVLPAADAEAHVVGDDAVEFGFVESVVDDDMLDEPGPEFAENADEVRRYVGCDVRIARFHVFDVGTTVVAIHLRKSVEIVLE